MAAAHGRGLTVGGHRRARRSALTEADRVAPGLPDHLAVLGVTAAPDGAEASLAA